MESPLDRIHAVEQQVERLDDHAFAVFLAWLDHYAEQRWAGGWPAGQARASVTEGSCATVMPAAWLTGAMSDACARNVISTPCHVAEPQAAAWLAQSLRRE